MIPTFSLQNFNLAEFRAYHFVAIAVWVLLFVSFVFSLLVLRQARQMTQVLPTRLTPWFRIAVIAYCIFTILAFGFGAVVIFG